MSQRNRPLIVAVAAWTLLVSACAGDDRASSPGVDSTTPTSIADGSAASTAAESSDAEPGETLVVWAVESVVEPLQAIAARFTESTGVDVRVEEVPIETMRDDVVQAVADGSGPDVFVGSHEWTGDLAAAGIVAPIDINVRRDEFVAVGLDAFNFDGQVYAVPLTTEAVALYRNTDLVPDAPATWVELEAGCDRVTVESCVVVPGGGEFSDAYHNYVFVSAFGGYVFGFDEATGFDPSTVGLDTPEAVRGVEFLSQQVDSGIVPPTDYADAKIRFLRGDAAFWITGPWELAEARSRDDLGFAVSVIPEIGEAPSRPFVWADGFFVSADSELTTVAQTLLLDFVSTDEFMRNVVADGVTASAWRPILTDPDADSEIRAFALSAANGEPMPNISHLGAVWEPLGDNLLLVRNGERAADEAMTAAADEVRTTLGG